MARSDVLSVGRQLEYLHCPSVRNDSQDREENSHKMDLLVALFCRKTVQNNTFFLRLWARKPSIGSPSSSSSSSSSIGTLQQGENDSRTGGQEEAGEAGEDFSRLPIECFDVKIFPDVNFGLGLRLDNQNNRIIINNFKRHPVSNQPMSAEASGQVSIGDELAAVNDISLRGKSLTDVVSIIRTILTNIGHENSIVLKIGREKPKPKPNKVQ